MFDDAAMIYDEMIEKGYLVVSGHCDPTGMDCIHLGQEPPESETLMYTIWHQMKDVENSENN